MIHTPGLHGVFPSKPGSHVSDGTESLQPDFSQQSIFLVCMFVTMVNVYWTLKDCQSAGCTHSTVPERILYGAD